MGTNTTLSHFVTQPPLVTGPRPINALLAGGTMHRNVSFTNLRWALTAMCGAALALCFASVGCGGSSSSNDSGTNTTCNFTQASAIFTAKGCALGGCHDGTSTESGGFDMASSGWETHLKGVNPKGGGTLEVCTPANGPYLVAGSNPATGLFLKKLAASPPCGVQMPFNMPSAYLTATELACVTSWATSVTTGP
jgi:hypothetical protein